MQVYLLTMFFCVRPGRLFLQQEARLAQRSAGAAVGVLIRAAERVIREEYLNKEYPKGEKNLPFADTTLKYTTRK